MNFYDRDIDGYISGAPNPYHYINSPWGRMAGGTLTYKDEETKDTITKLLEGDVEDKEKVLRAYMRARDSIEEGGEYDDEEEQEKDLAKINKRIQKLEDEIKQDKQADEEDDEMMDEYKAYKNKIDELTKDEVLDMKQLLMELYGENKIPDKEYDELMEKLIDKDIQLEGIKPVKRQSILPEYNDEIHYTIQKDYEDDKYNLVITEGSNNQILNKSMDILEEYANTLIQNKGIEKFRKEIYTIIGNINEDNLLNYPTFFQKAEKFNGNLFNTSNPECKYYTKKLIDRYNYFFNLNKDNNGRDKYDKTKLDYFLFDYITNNVGYEIKTLTQTFDFYKNRGFINLVSNKITGEDGEYKPIFTNDKKIKNVLVETNKLNFECLNITNLNYIIIFCLKDGNYKYEPLKDENFVLYKDKGNLRGKLTYGKIFNDYKIPTDKLIKIN